VSATGSDLSELIVDEAVKAAAREICSIAFPGVQTVMRLALVTVQRGPLENALEAALTYQFAHQPDEQPARRGPAKVAHAVTRLPGAPRRVFRRRRTTKRTRTAAITQGLDVTGLLVASTERAYDMPSSEDNSPTAPARSAPLLDLMLVEFREARRPLLPPSQGWRHHAARSLSVAAEQGLRGDEQEQEHWRSVLGHALGIADDHQDHVADWGRLVAAAFELEIRKDSKLRTLHDQLRQADSAEQITCLVLSAQSAKRSLNVIAGCAVLVTVVVTALLAVDLF
jgi:hypothetical protein